MYKCLSFYGKRTITQNDTQIIHGDILEGSIIHEYPRRIRGDSFAPQEEFYSPVNKLFFIRPLSGKRFVFPKNIFVYCELLQKKYSVKLTSEVDDGLVGLTATRQS